MLPFIHIRTPVSITLFADAQKSDSSLAAANYFKVCVTKQLTLANTSLMQSQDALAMDRLSNGLAVDAQQSQDNATESVCVSWTWI